MANVFNILVSDVAVSIDDYSGSFVAGEYYTAFKEAGFKKAETSTTDKSKTIVPTNYELAGTVIDVTYHKKMYEISSLDLEVYVNVSDTSSSKHVDAFKDASINILEDRSNTAGSHKFFNVTKGFTVHSVSMKRNNAVLHGNSGFFIVLHAGGADKYLDLHKYSKSYTTKKLGEISLPKSLSLDMGDNNPVFPYLVQYNETLFDFLVRSANRSDRYLFYENGKLYCSGLYTKDNKQYIGTDEVTSYKTDESVLAYAMIETNDYYSLDDGLTVNGISDTYLGTQSTLSKNLAYHDEVMDDSRYTKLDSGRDNYTGESVLSNGIRTVSVLGALAQGDSLVNCLAASTMKWEEINSVRGRLTTDLKDDFSLVNGGYNTEVDKYGTKLDYAGIAKKQRENKDKTVTLTLTNTPNIFLLGNIFDTNYVVEEITGKWTCEMTPASHTEAGSGKVTSKHTIVALNKAAVPYLGDKTIRKASAQKAIVTQVNDPLRMGRVRVRYPWDLEDQVTPWLRVISPAAYKNGGFNFTPAVGDEVIVGYEGGNIERPIIEGYVHNNSNKPNLADRLYIKHGGGFRLMTDGKTNSTNSDCKTNNGGGSCNISNGSGQMISLTSGADAKLFTAGILPGCLKTAGITVGDDKNAKGETVGDKHLGGAITLTDAYGICTIKNDTAARCITINSAIGQVKISAFDGITISAPNGDITLKGKNITLDAGNNVTVKSGSNKSWFGFNTLVSSLTKSFTKEFMKMEGAVTKYCKGTDFVNGWADIAFARSCVEVALRPIEGTVMLKSPGYILLSDGTGGDMSNYNHSGFNSSRDGDNKKKYTVSKFRGWGSFGTKLGKQNSWAWMDDKKNWNYKADVEGMNATTLAARNGTLKTIYSLAQGLVDGFTEQEGLGSLAESAASMSEWGCNLNENASWLKGQTDVLVSHTVDDTMKFKHIAAGGDDDEADTTGIFGAAAAQAPENQEREGH